MVRADPVAWVRFSDTLALQKNFSRMNETGYMRCLDSVGRLVIPSKLRTQLNLGSGTECKFYTTEFEGNTYLCIKCPTQLTDLERAMQIVQQNGFKIVESAD